MYKRRQQDTLPVDSNGQVDELRTHKLAITREELDWLKARKRTHGLTLTYQLTQAVREYINRESDENT